jgi:hypothetical protein
LVFVGAPVRAMGLRVAISVGRVGSSSARVGLTIRVQALVKKTASRYPSLVSS